jgi:hypothetical protein
MWESLLPEEKVLGMTLFRESPSCSQHSECSKNKHSEKVTRSALNQKRFLCLGELGKETHIWFRRPSQVTSRLG